MNKHTIVLAVLIIVLVLYLVITHVNNSINITESFIDPTPSIPSECPTQPVLNWWDTNPIRAIISKYSGIGVNVCPAGSTDCTIGNIGTQYHVFIESPDPSIPKGSLSIDNTTGIFSKVTINSGDSNQLWLIKMIKSSSDLGTLLGNPNMSILNAVNYPYCVVISSNSVTIGPIRALQYENGTLSVRLLGDYAAQMWDINKLPVATGISILANNQLSNFSPEYVAGGVGSSVAMTNANNEKQIMSSLNKILGYIQSNNVNTAPSTSVFGSSPLSVNVKFASPTATPSVNKFADTANTSKEDVRSLLNQYNQAQLGILMGTNNVASTANAFNGLCKTPNMSEYVSTVGIPCTACANF